MDLLLRYQTACCVVNKTRRVLVSWMSSVSLVTLNPWIARKLRYFFTTAVIITNNTEKHQVLQAMKTMPCAVACRYNVVQHNVILHMVWQWLRKNMNQRLYSQKTPHISPSRASYGVSFVRIWMQNESVITASHSIAIYHNTIELPQNIQNKHGTDADLLVVQSLN